MNVWTAVARFDPVPPRGRSVRWVPLILAPAWADDHPEEPPARPGLELLQQLFDHLTGKAPQPPRREPDTWTEEPPSGSVQSNPTTIGARIMPVEFPNRARHVAAPRTVEFTATAGGNSIACLVPEEQLRLMAGTALRSDDEALQAFDQNREMIEQAVQRQIDRNGIPAEDGTGRRELHVLVVTAG